MLAVVAGLVLVSGAGCWGLAQIALSGPKTEWGYVAASEAFVLSTLASAPPLALISRVGRGLWGVPARRLAELCGLGSLVVLALDVLLIGQLPRDWQGRPGIWLDWPGAPGVWHAAALGLLALTSVAMLWITARPDARTWRGTPQQWYVVGLGVRALGTLYAMALTFAHLLVASDFAMSLVPGWQSPNFAAYHVISGLEGGIASVVIGLAILRTRTDVFHACGKLLLSLALLWFYFSWSEFLTYWYGRTPAEQDLIALLMAQPLYAGAALGCCVLPFLILLWNRWRASPTAVSVAASLIVIGMLLDRLRVFVPAWAVAGPIDQRLQTLPGLTPPSLAAVLVLLGVPALGLLLVVVLGSILGPNSGWEQREAALLRTHRPYLRTRVSVIGRPG